MGSIEVLLTESSCPRPRNSYAVCLAKAPRFPGNGKETKGIAEIYRGYPVTVVAANDDGGVWGWVNLNSVEKEKVGRALLDLSPDFCDWFWCEQFEAAK